MASLLIVIPILIVFFIWKKREPTQNEFGFWILFLLPIVINIGLFISKEEPIWWLFVVFWILAFGVLVEKRGS